MTKGQASASKSSSTAFGLSRRAPSLVVASLACFLWTATASTLPVSAFVPHSAPSRSRGWLSHSSSSSFLKMSGGLMDAANFAVSQAPATTRFVTNKMCPFAQKVWIALEAAKAPYELEEVALYGPGGKPDWFWDLNPDGTVPVLVCHGGAVVLPDSDLALDQLAKGSAVPLQPRQTGSDGDTLMQLPQDDKKLRKRVDQWRKDINTMLPIGKQAVLGGKKDKLFKLLKDMNGQVVGPYLCGDHVTIADCAAFPFLWRLNDEYGLDDYDKLQQWLKTCQANPAFSKTVQKSWWWWW